MIVIVLLLALGCLALLASPWPYLAPFAVLGPFALAALYRRPAWGLLGLVALVPFEGLFKTVDLSAAKLLGASLVLILSIQVLRGHTAARDLHANLWKPLLLLWLCIVLSLMFSENIALSLDSLRELAIGMVLLPMTLLAARRMDWTMLCRILALSVAATCLIALFSARHQVGGRAIGLLQDANYFALLIAIALPAAVLLALRASHWSARLFWIGITIVLLAGMVKTDSRSGLLVVLLGTLIGLWHYRAELKRLRPRHLGFVMLGAAIALPLTLAVMPADYVARIKSLSLLKSGINAHRDPSLGRRSSYLVVGANMIAHHPLLGSGPGSFAPHYARTGYAKAFSELSGRPDLFRRAHNTYLELSSELGVPAGLFFVSIVVWGLRNFARARQAFLTHGAHAQANLATHLGLSLAAMSLFMLFLSVPNHKYLWLFLGLSCVLRQQAETSAPP